MLVVTVDRMTNQCTQQKAPHNPSPSQRRESLPIGWEGTADLFLRHTTQQSQGAAATQVKPTLNVVLQDSIYFAYFPPYSYVRHQELVARIHANKNVRLEVLGETLDGYDLDLLRIGRLPHCHTA